MRRVVFILALALIASACGRPRSSEVFVGSASSFALAVDVIRDSYDAHFVKVLTAGSHTLVSQILDDAPIDVIVTADLRTMRPLVAAGKTAENPTLLARNRLVIAVDEGNPLGISSLADLARPDVKLVLAGPEVPLGSYSAAVLERAGVDVRPVSLTDNAVAVSGLISIGEADAGLVYQTDLGFWNIDGVALPDQANVLAEYYIAPLTEAPNLDGARRFVEFLLSDEGRSLLEGLGFSV